MVRLNNSNIEVMLRATGSLFSEPPIKQKKNVASGDGILCYNKSSLCIRCQKNILIANSINIQYKDTLQFSQHIFLTWKHIKKLIFRLPSTESKKVCLLEFVCHYVLFKFHADKPRLSSLTLQCNHQRVKLLSVYTNIRINEISEAYFLFTKSLVTCWLKAYG